MRHLIKKKPAMILLAALLLNTICFVSVFAYGIHKDKAVNRFTVGHNTIDVTEDFTPPDELKPGITIPKKVVIANTGKVPCVIRVLAKYNNEEIADFATIDFNTASWYKGSDGYHYYRYPVNVSKETVPLFTKVKIADDAPEALLKDFDVLVYAESKNAKMDSDFKAIWGI